MENNLLEISPNLYKRVLRLMGNMFEISVCANEGKHAAESFEAAIAEMQRIERLLTTFDPASQTNQINTQAGIQPVKVDREVFELIQRSLKISELTQGAFDITYGSIDKRLWNFDTSMTMLPDKETAKRSVKLINYKNVILDKEASTVGLNKSGKYS